MQISAAHYIRWLFSSFAVVGSELKFSGWALAYPSHQDDVRFFMNGNLLTDVIWPVDRPDLVEVFDLIPGADLGGFEFRKVFATREAIFPEGFARLSVTGPLGIHGHTYRTDWFFTDPQAGPAVPSDDQIARVIGVRDSASYLMGGATLAKRFEAYLRERFGISYAECVPLLDWGCGSGRLTRHLVSPADGSVHGADIDPDNISWCAANLPGASFHLLSPDPPTPFAQGQFGLIIAISVLTHLSERNQFDWLQELSRICRRGGLVLVSIQGRGQGTLYRWSTQSVPKILRDGFVTTSEHNTQLDPVIGEQCYYKDVIQSHDYIRSHWSRYFEVVDIVEGMAANQDLIVLRKL